MPSKLNQLLEQQLKQDFASIDNMLLVDYQGLNSEKMQEFRAKLRQSKLKMEVVKNSIFKIAVKDLPAGKIVENKDGVLKEDPLTGPVGVIHGGDSVVEAARFAVEWLKGNEKTIRFKAALMGQEVFGPTQVVELSKLPSRKELLAMLACTVQAPAQKLASTVQAGYARVVWALNALAEKLEKAS